MPTPKIKATSTTKPRSARRRKRSAPERATNGSYELSDRVKAGYVSLNRLFRTNPANAEVYNPGESQRIPAAGAWVLIPRQLPPLEGNIDRNIRVGRVFYVERSGSNVDAVGFAPDGTYKVLCRSPWGDVCLWPYEYSTLPTTTLVDLWTAGELVFHPLRVEAARFSEVVFYARSRGIALADAAVMALGAGEFAGSIGWFEPRPDLAAECEAMERRVHSRLAFRERKPRHAQDGL